MSANWGPCRTCKWWKIEPDASEAPQTVGVCIEKELQQYVLRVSGASGCNRFVPGRPKHEEGASESPPTPDMVGA